MGLLATAPVSGKPDGEPGPGTTSAGVIVCGIAFVDVHKSCADLQVHVFDIKAPGTGTVVPVPVYRLVAVTVYTERNGNLKKGKLYMITGCPIYYVTVSHGWHFVRNEAIV